MNEKYKKLALYTIIITLALSTTWLYNNPKTKIIEKNNTITEIVEVPVYINNTIIEIVEVPIYVNNTITEIVEVPVYINNTITETVEIPIYINNTIIEIKTVKVPVYITNTVIETVEVPVYINNTNNEQELDKWYRTLLLNGTNLNGWEINSGNIVIENDSIRFNTPEIAGKYAKISKIMDLDMSDKFLQFKFKVDRIEPTDAIMVEFFSSDSKYARNIISIGGSAFRSAIDFVTIRINKADVVFGNGFTETDWKTINRIYIGFRTGTNKIKSTWIKDIELINIMPTNGIVTFRFDDGKETDYTEAFRIMKEYGYSGTTFVCPSSVNTPNYLSVTQMNEMYDYGWDISSHSYTHYSFDGSIDYDILAREIENSNKWLLDMRFDRSASFFAVPFYKITSEAQKKANEVFLMTFGGLPWWSI